jgi:protein TonB
MRSVQGMGALTDPLGDLIGVTRRDRWWLGLSCIFSVCVHCALGWALPYRMSSGPTRHAAITAELIDVDLPEPVEVKTLPEPAPEAAPAPKARMRKPPGVKEPPQPSELAQAASVVTRQDDPNEPVDLTSFVVGTATAYAGGTTASTGTSTKAVYGANIAGNGKRTGTVGSGPTADKSRPPSVVGDSNWNCPFPLEADVDRISHAIATIRVDVDAGDKVTRVDVLQDPAHGFGEAARRCAMGKSWRAAQNRDGIPVAGSITVRVRFIR